MLAGNMKLKTFLAVAAIIGVAAVALIYISCDGSEPKAGADAKPTATARETTTTNPSKPEPAAATTAAATAGGKRAVDVAVMSWRGKDLGAKKKKDVSKGKPFKINVYQDGGKATVNRVKVDLDRDGKWDEKWTFDGDKIKRKVSPNDDENYSDKYKWVNGAWKKK